jgi:AcrR family transcriptional regulator
MEKTEQKRQALAEKMADHLLVHGLAAFTLRSLGAATGTSDRMLLHYFTDKQELLSTTLQLISERLLTRLRSLQSGKQSEAQLISFLAGLLQHPEVIPYTNLWLELTAVAIREGEPYRAIAAQIADAFLEWIKASLDDEAPPRHDESAAFILAFIEGLVLLRAIGKESEVSKALSRAEPVH